MDLSGVVTKNLYTYTHLYDKGPDPVLPIG